MSTDEMVAWLEAHGWTIDVYSEGDVYASRPGKRRRYVERGYAPFGGGLAVGEAFWRIEVVPS